jgi:HYDIN/CFA65/VesB-like, Ig-like domain
MSAKNKNSSTRVRAQMVAAALLGMGAAAAPGWADTDADRSVTISNTGDGPLQLTSVTLSAGFVRGAPTAQECGQTLGPGEHCQITIRFAPEHVGPQTGTLTVATNDPQRPALVVELKGTGVPGNGDHDGDDGGRHHDHDHDHDHDGDNGRRGDRDGR